MIRSAVVVALLACSGVLPLAAQDSVACKEPGGPMRFLASELSPWRTGPSGVARMNLVGHSPPYATEVRVYRERYPATFLGDSTKAPVHRTVGTAYILVLTDPGRWPRRAGRFCKCDRIRAAEFRRARPG